MCVGDVLVRKCMEFVVVVRVLTLCVYVRVHIVCVRVCACVCAFMCAVLLVGLCIIVQFVYLTGTTRPLREQFLLHDMGYCNYN